MPARADRVPVGVARRPGGGQVRAGLAGSGASTAVYGARGGAARSESPTAGRPGMHDPSGTRPDRPRRAGHAGAPRSRAAVVVRRACRVRGTRPCRKAAVVVGRVLRRWIHHPRRKAAASGWPARRRPRARYDPTAVIVGPQPLSQGPRPSCPRQGPTAPRPAPSPPQGVRRAGKALTVCGSGPAAGAAPGARKGQETRPYQTLLDQIFWSFTTSPVFGACQILLWPA